MRPGRMVFLSDYFGADGAATGGAGIASLNSFEILAGMGARVQMLSGYFTPETVAARPEVRSLGGRDLRAGSQRSGLKTIYNAEARRGLAPMLQDLDPASTIIVLHQWTRWLSPSVLGLLSAFKVMIYMHDYFWFCPNGAYYNFTTEQPCTLRPLGIRCVSSDCDRAGYGHKIVRVARLATKALLSSSDAGQRLFLHLSELSRRTTTRVLPQEAHEVIHNPLPPSLADEPVRLETPLYDVGYFGRLETEKGVMDLCRALSRSGLRAAFVGSGSLAPMLRSIFGPDAVIEWSGHTAALSLMRRCKVVTLPSRWPETWGLVVAEALAQGRPVLVSNRAGSAELVERFGGGLVFEPDGPDVLLTALKRLLAGGYDLAAAQRAAASVQEALSPGVHGQRLINLAAERWGIDIQDGGDHASPMFAGGQALKVDAWASDSVEGVG